MNLNQLKHIKIFRLLPVMAALILTFNLSGCEELSYQEIHPDSGITEKTAGITEKTAGITEKTAGITEKTADITEKTAGITEKTVRIISTSDLHGKMLAYDYALDQPDASGSLAQVSSAINEYRDDNTILADIGDTIQDNVADIFKGDEIFPMVIGMNAIGYDVCTTGNHEYNFGMDITKKYIETLACDFVLGNVYDENNEPLAKGYTIIEKNGVRIAFIGMITPNIQNWDKKNLKGYTVTDPALETNKIIDSIEKQVELGAIEPVDIIVGMFHMMEDDEYGVVNSGFASMAQSCPRLDLILGAHGHSLLNKTLEGNIPVSENLNSGKTIQIADITVSKEAGMPSSIKEIKTTYVETKDYPEDPVIVDKLASFDSYAKEYSRTKVGVLEGGPMVGPSEINGISLMLTEDTPMQTFVQNVMIHYADTDVAISAPCTNEDNADPGDLTMSGICRMYKYSNTLYSVKMTGAQFKKYLEWSASFYQQYKPGDLIIAFDDVPVYMYDTAGGVNYDIDISKPVGERIVNLTYPDGKPVVDTDEMKVAINNYRYNTVISIPGVVFDEDDMPELIEADIRSDIGDIRFLMIDYIKNVMNGTLTPECDYNWKLIGNDWDEELHEKAVEQINNGTLQLEKGAKSNPCIVKITEDDLPE